MKQKEITIIPPKGYEIDKEKSTFERIVFKEKKKELPKKWEDLEELSGYYTGSSSIIYVVPNAQTTNESKNIFKTKEQAEASIAMAQLSQLLHQYNDGWIPNYYDTNRKYTIVFMGDSIQTGYSLQKHNFLSFKTIEIRDKFLKNFKDLILKAKPLL